MKTWLPIVVAAALALVLGLVLGLRGCGGDANKLLQENAVLKARVDEHRATAQELSKQRDAMAGQRIAAEQEAAKAKEQADAAAKALAALRRRVTSRAASKACEPERDLIAALDVARASDVKQIDFLNQALDNAKMELEQGYQIEQALNSALVASEERAEKLEKHVGKSRRQKIWIGVGAGLGGIGLTLASVAAAGKLQ